MLTRLHAILPHVAAYLLYLTLATFITFPLVTGFATRYAGHPFSDSYELARHIWWIQHALQNGLPVLPQPLLAYPDGLDGALLWAYPLQSFPAWLFAFFMPLPAAYNLTILLRLALNGWSVYWLVRYLTGGKTLPALLAGTVFLAYPTFQGHLVAGHIGLLALWPFVFYAYALFRLRETGQRRYVALGALFFVMSAWGSTQLLLFTTALLTGLFALALVIRKEWRALARLGIVIAIGGAGVAVFAIPLLRANEQQAVELSSSVITYSADLLGIIAPSFAHPLFRDYEVSRRVLGIDPFEGAAYVGIVAAILALVSLWKRRAARWWGALALVAWVLSLGPLLKVFYRPLEILLDGYVSYIPLPYALIGNLPFINITRAPGRFNFAVALGVAVMAGYGAAYLMKHFRGRWMRLVVIALIPLVVYEYQFWWNADGTFPELLTIPGVVPEPMARLGERGDIRAILDVPWAHPLVAKEGLWLQTGHQHPLVAGHMTRQTSVNPAKLTILQETLDPALLNEAGVDIIILHREWDDAEGIMETHLHEQLGEPFYEDERFAVFDVPDSSATPAFVALATDETIIRQPIESSVYTPEPITIAFRIAYRGDSYRMMRLYRNGVFVTHLKTDDAINMGIAIPIETGYHTFSLELEPPCPSDIPMTLECNPISLAYVSFEPVVQPES